MTARHRVVPALLLLALAAPGLPALPAAAATPESAPGIELFSSTGPAVTLRTTGLHDAAAGVRWTRSSDGLPTVTRQITAENTDLTQTDLQVGRAYTFAARYVGARGELGPVATRSIVATLPPVLAADVRAPGPFAVRLAAPGNAADTSYDVRYGVVRKPSYISDFQTTWLTGVRAGSATFGAPEGAGQRATSVTPGSSYVFVGEARDRFGNVHTERYTGRVVVPLDQTAASLSGASTRAAAGAYGGSSAVLLGRGSTASVALRGDVLQVLGERCPTCGAVDVVLDGVRLARVDTRAATRSTRQVLWSRTFLTERRGQLVVRSVGTAGRPQVIVDAFVQRADAGGNDRAVAVSGQRLVNDLGARGLESVDYRSFAGFVDDRFQVATTTKVLWRPTSRTATELRVQADGNLVLLSGQRPLWSSGTAGQGRVTLHLGRDGNLVLYRDSDGRAVWSWRTGRLRVPAVDRA